MSHAILLLLNLFDRTSNVEKIRKKEKKTLLVLMSSLTTVAMAVAMEQATLGHLQMGILQMTLGHLQMGILQTGIRIQRLLQRWH